MRALKSTCLGMGLLGALAGCMANGEVAGAGSTLASSSSAQPVPGTSPHWGSTVAGMADQYNRPHPGGVSATGASAWVAPAPPPAMVATNLPPAAPPAPPPAAVANRQPAPTPAARPAVDASSIARPEAAAPEAAAPAAPTLSAATRAAGRKLFADYSCGACHGLADAGSSGGIGPSFDGNPRLSKDYVVSILTTGRGAMPSFAGQLSEAEMATLAEYVVGASRK